MRLRFVIGGILIAAVAGCAQVRESRLNPFNWFGRGEEVTDLTPGVAGIADPRALVAEVVSLRVERVTGGAIVRATGRTLRQGYFDADLVPLNRERPVDGVLSYQFRISPPYEATRVGTERSREVVVGRFVSDQTLAAVRTIRVAGAANALGARR